MKIKRFIGGMLESNGYVIYQKDGGDAFIIDPGYNPGVFTEYIKEHSLILRGILLTHHHYDHVGAVERIRAAMECPVYLHRSDCDMYRKKGDKYTGPYERRRMLSQREEQGVLYGRYHI